jgi:hypothetical protein
MKTDYKLDGNDTTCCMVYRYDGISSKIIRVKATAHLHKGDKFDEKTGRKIAFMKAKEKMLNSLWNTLRREWGYSMGLPEKIRAKEDKCLKELDMIENKFKTGNL